MANHASQEEIWLSKKESSAKSPIKTKSYEIDENNNVLFANQVLKGKAKSIIKDIVTIELDRNVYDVVATLFMDAKDIIECNIASHEFSFSNFNRGDFSQIY